MSKELVVKSNRLNMAIQNLSLSEVRIIQLAIIDARDTGLGLTTTQPLRIDAMRYAEAFGVSRQTAYEMILEAEKNLFERRFTFLDEKDGNPVKSRWVQQAKYIKNEGAIEIILTLAVVEEITRIDGAEQFFTKYLLEQTASLKSVYSVRLYELLIQWQKTKKTPLFELQEFREQLGLEDNEYKLMSNFKLRVLDLAVSEINEKSDIAITYTQEKKGRIIIGFKFTVKVKDKPKANKDKPTLRDVNTADMFTTDGLSDAQLARIAKNPQFITDYNHLVSPQSSAGQGGEAWVTEMVKRLKLDPKQFSKKPIRGYLEY